MKRNTRTIMASIILLFIQCFHVALGQPNPVTSNYVPKLISPSPNAASLGKYGQIPVGLFTGIPQITVPVYDLKTSKLFLPINLSYHAAGIKVDELSSWVGLAWSLNAGGAITRSVVGKPDDAGGYLTEKPLLAANINPTTDWQYLEGVAVTNSRDSDPDMFFFNFGNHSGKFVFGEDNNPIIIPNKPLKIVYQSGTFKVTDETGTIYLFEEKETTKAGTYPSSYDYTFTSSWYLTKIVSSDLSDTIQFFYKNGSSIIEEKTYSYSESIGNYWSPYQCGNGSETHTCVSLAYKHDINSVSISYRQTQPPKLLDYILFKNGKIEFLSASDRLDVSGERLTGIKVYNQNLVTGAYNLLKYTKFEQDYYYSSQQNQYDHQTYKQYRLRLLKVYDYNEVANERINQYTFEYNSNPLPPVNNYAQDKWGFFNGQFTNQGLLEQHSETYSNQSWTVGNAVRSVNGETMKNGVIKKIIYPTGGYTEFDFEPHQYAGVIGGGLRIKSLTNFDGAAIATLQTFNYGPGTLVSTSAAFDNITYKRHYYGTSGVGISCVPNVTSEPRKTFNSTSSYPLESVNGSPIVYESVTKYEGNELVNAGKTEYTYKVVLNSYFPVSTSYESGVYQVSNSWENGQLLKEIAYKYQNGLYHPVLESIYDYYKINGAIGRGLKVGNSYVVGGCYNFPNPDYNWYYYFDYPIYSGIYLLKEQKVKSYDESGNFVQTITNYTYDNLIHYQPTRIETTNSKNITLKTENKYPHDFAGTPAYDSMISKNIITPVVESKNYSNNILQTYQKNNYGFWYGTSLILPSSIQTATFNNPLQTEVDFANYDNQANILQLNPKSGLIKSYLWGYKNQYPIAEAINAKSNEIFFDGFEENTPGWEWSLTAYDNSFKRTGSSSGRIDKPTPGEQVCISNKWLNVSLTATKKFKFSGWVYSNNPSVELFLIMKRAGESGYFSYFDRVETTVTGQWVYLEKVADVPADVVQMAVRLDNNGGGTVWFDDIRLHPDAALMTTYTYNPLIGMTSQCDVNNRITYYEYEQFNRLFLIRDQDKNIVKKICYNYAGQQENCTVNTTPQWTTTGNYRCVLDGSGQNTGYQEREERDNNSNSATYNQTHWVGNGYNATACPPPNNCNYSNCGFEGYRCVYGQCEQGFRVNTYSYYDYSMGQYVCVYHYEFSDGSWSSDYYEYSYWSACYQ